MNYILTCSGRRFYFEKPDPESIFITDIASALSRMCRFTGHTREFYSVAQHSLIVSKLVPEKYALEGLMHDAHEAYVGDMSTPLKRTVLGFHRIEQIAEAAVRGRYMLMPAMPMNVKEADKIALMTERRDLLPVDLTGEDDGWEAYVDVDPLKQHILPMSVDEAEDEFLARFDQLCAPWMR